MSVSAFHRHFKAVTAPSPLQCQKRVRLLHARSLLVGVGKNITTAALEVGYESPTQFRRERARTFWQAPGRDASRILAQVRGRPWCHENNNKRWTPAARARIKSPHFLFRNYLVHLYSKPRSPGTGASQALSIPVDASLPACN